MVIVRRRTRRAQVGLLYDEQALQEAVDLTADWTREERAALRDQVPRMGLATPFRGGTVQQVSQRVLAIAKVRVVTAARKWAPPHSALCLLHRAACSAAS